MTVFHSCAGPLLGVGIYGKLSFRNMAICNTHLYSQQTTLQFAKALSLISPTCSYLLTIEQSEEMETFV